VPRPRQRVDIVGRSWRVHFVKKKILHGGVECDGYVNRDAHLIQISLNQAKDRQRSTLIHELLHAIIDTTSSVHYADEEKCVQALESGLFPFLRSPHNEWVLKFLLEQE
jgi:Zn-dependent peptidase ImmA (M78 family)